MKTTTQYRSHKQQIQIHVQWSPYSYMLEELAKIYNIPT